jgi:hypothetical protein
MRPRFFASLILAFLLAAPSFGQGFIEYVNRADRFSINFYGEPTVREIMFEPFEGPPVPAREYTTRNGDSTFKVVVVDYTKNYTASNWPFAYSGANAVQGSIAQVAADYRKRGVATYDAYDRLNLIPGIVLQITEPNMRRLFVSLYLYDRRLYIIEASVPGDAPPPALFRNSLAILDSQGEAVRFNENGDRARGGPPITEGLQPEPPAARGGRGGGAQGGGGRGGAQ